MREITLLKGSFLTAALAGVSVLFCAAAPAPAMPIVFFGEDAGADSDNQAIPNAAAAEAAFLANLIGVEVEDFEAFTAGSTFPLVSTFGTTTATLTGSTTVAATGIRDGALFGRFAISETQYLNLGTTDASSLVLTFSEPQAAFGFYGTDIGDFGGQLTISLNSGPVIDIPHTVGVEDGSALYFGLIDLDNPFTSISFLSDVTEDAFGFDDFTIGTAEQVMLQVREPAAATLLALGLAALAVAARRRKRATVVA